MARLTYSDIKGVIDHNMAKGRRGYDFPLTPRLNNIIGNLDTDQIHIISGMPSAGTTSFMDQQYVMSVLLQWYAIKEEERPNLKIVYYSMAASELKKMQLLLCEYLKLVHNLRVDVPTLNSRKGKLYDISQDAELQDAIEDATPFFNEVIDDEVLTILDGQRTPTDVYNTLVTYMEGIGYYDDSKKFVLDDEHKDELVLVVIDSLDYMIQDSDGYGTISGTALHDKMKRYMRELKDKFHISFAATMTAPSVLIRKPSDGEPNYRQLGQYGPIADRGIMLYNPIVENNRKFFDDADVYVSSKGNILLRTWHVVRNTDGMETVDDRLLFLPGTGYLVEYS